MAESLSRADPSSPAGVAGASFGTARKGFDQHQVREFLRQVAGELTGLQEREAALQRELQAAQAAQAAAQPATLDEDTVTRLLGEEAVRILHTARESGAQIKAKAEEGAARLLREASEESARIRQETDVEIARRRHDASADVEAELAMAKQQGREMVEEARTYRERVLGELARRRETARAQIDQLVRSRDRLVQAFEKARLTAADVIAEISPLETPDEEVDLSPTTGPVPLTRVPSPDQSAVGTTALPGELAPPQVPADDSARDTADASADATAMYDREHEPADGERDGGGGGTPDASVQTETETEGDVDHGSDDGEADGTAGAATVGVGDRPSTTSETDATPDADARSEDDAARAAADDEVDSGPDATIVPFPGASPAPTAAPAAVDDLFARLRAESADDDGESSDDPHDADDQGGDDEPEAVATASPEAADATSDGTASDDTAPVETSSVDTTDVEPTPAADRATDGSGDEGDDAESPFTIRDAALVPLIVAAARKYKRALADEQNDVLDALRRNDAVTSLDTLVPDEGTQAQRYTAAIAAELGQAAGAGANAVAADGAEIDVSGSTAASGDALARNLVTPLRERLARSVDEGAGDSDAIVKRVRAVYREWKTQRIDEQLDHIFRTAYARAAFDAITPGDAVAWLVDPAGPQSPDCEDNSLSGSVAAGESFPTGHTHPPAHPGCRCLLLPAAATS